MKRYFIFLVVTLPLVILLAYGLTRDPRALPSMMIGKKAPAFSLKTLDGKIVTLESFAGENLVINFWATWCGPCFQEHAVLKKAREEHSEKIRFLGIVYQDRVEDVKQYLKELGEPFEVLLDPEDKMGIDYGVGGVPETFFVDAQGVIREKHSGILTTPYLELMIQQLKGP